MQEHIGGSFYELTITVGEMAAALAKKIYAFLRLVFHPLAVALSFLISLIVRLVVYIAKKTRMTFHELHVLFKEIAAVARLKKEDGRRSFGHYTRVAVRRHKGLFRYAGNVLVVALVVAGLILSYYEFDMMTLGLELTVDGESIGIVEDESVYYEARNEAIARMSLSGGEIPSAEMSIVFTVVTNISDAEDICNELIARSDTPSAYACGVYIDGELVCAVDSQQTAINVLNDILDDYTSDDSNVSYDFVEEITFDYGLFPDDDSVIISSSDMLELLTATESQVYTVSEGDTLESIAALYGVSEEDLEELNSELDFDELTAGQTVTISQDDALLTIKMLTTNTYTISVAYDTVTIDSDSLYSGDTLVLQEGEQGIDQVTEITTTIDGEDVSTVEVSRFTVQEAVSERIAVGTKIASVVQYTKSFGGVLLWPAPDNCFSISSTYGYRSGKLHAGIDIVSSNGGSCKGRAIVAAAAGTVVAAQYHWSWGYYIKIDHGNGVMTLYAHCMADSFLVDVGDTVVAGQQIASIGATGNATGYHLHFEVWIDGTRVNPLPYVYSESVSVVS